MKKLTAHEGRGLEDRSPEWIIQHCKQVQAILKNVLAHVYREEGPEQSNKVFEIVAPIFMGLQREQLLAHREQLRRKGYIFNEPENHVSIEK